MSATIKAIKVAEAAANLQAARIAHSADPTKTNAGTVAAASDDLDEALIEFWVCVDVGQ